MITGECKNHCSTVFFPTTQWCITENKLLLTKLPITLYKQFNYTIGNSGCRRNLENHAGILHHTSTVTHWNLKNINWLFHSAVVQLKHKNEYRKKTEKGHASWCLTHSTRLTSEKKKQNEQQGRSTKVPSAGLKLCHSVQSWVLGAAFAMWSSVTKTGILFGVLSYPLLSWYPFGQLVSGAGRWHL